MKCILCGGEIYTGKCDGCSEMIDYCPCGTPLRELKDRERPMTRDEAKRLVVATVNNKQGCKATELAAVVEVATCGHPITELIEETIKDGSIIEVGYVLPHLEWREKSFLLPKGTKIVGIINHRGGGKTVAVLNGAQVTSLIDEKDSSKEFKELPDPDDPGLLAYQ